MKITNQTPLLMWISPNNSYQIRATLKPDGSTYCRFTDERMIAVINGVPHHMARMVPGSYEWLYTHTTNSNFTVSFIGRFKTKRLWFVRESSVTDGPHNIQIAAAPTVTLNPTELMFYFDSDVPNTDKTTTLHNGLTQAVHVSAASVQGADASTFTLISPTAFDFLVAGHASVDFVVRFTNDTRQREANLVINTGQGTFTARLSGKYFLW